MLRSALQVSMLILSVRVEQAHSVTPVTSSAGLEELLEKQKQQQQQQQQYWYHRGGGTVLFFCSIDTSPLCSKAAEEYGAAAAELEKEGTACGVVNMDNHFDHSLLEKHTVTKPGPSFR